MKTLRLILLLLVTCSFFSCQNNERASFEKAMREVYGSDVKHEEIHKELSKYIEGEKIPEYHLYTMEFETLKEMAYSFYRLIEKVDSIMDRNYPSNGCLYSIYEIRESWDTKSPLTTCMWWTNEFFITVTVDRLELKHNKYVVELRYEQKHDENRN